MEENWLFHKKDYSTSHHDDFFSHAKLNISLNTGIPWFCTRSWGTYKELDLFPCGSWIQQQMKVLILPIRRLAGQGGKSILLRLELFHNSGMGPVATTSGSCLVHSFSMTPRYAQGVWVWASSPASELVPDQDRSSCTDTTSHTLHRQGDGLCAKGVREKSNRSLSPWLIELSFVVTVAFQAQGWNTCMLLLSSCFPVLQISLKFSALELNTCL